MTVRSCARFDARISANTAQSRSDRRYNIQGNRAHSGRSRNWTSNRAVSQGSSAVVRPTMTRCQRMARAERRASGSGIGGPGIFPIGGLSGRGERSSVTCSRLGDCAQALQADSLTSGLRIERHFRHGPHPRGDDQDQAEGSYGEKRWCASRAEDGGSSDSAGFEGHG